MQKITPFLWFDNQAEEAAKFYVAGFSAKVGYKRHQGVKRRVRREIAQGVEEIALGLRV